MLWFARYDTLPPIRKATFPFRESSDMKRTPIPRPAAGRPDPGRPPEDRPPAPDDFYARPHGSRKALTPNDIRRNRGVDRLFDAITPGLPIDADPPETRTSAVRISQPVENILKRLNIRASPWIDALTEAWPRIVPPAVSNFARPGKWDASGILYLYVSSSVHLFEIRRMHLREIERAVRAFAGDRFRIRQVRLTVNTVPAPPPPAPPPPPPPAFPPSPPPPPFPSSPERHA